MTDKSISRLMTPASLSRKLVGRVRRSTEMPTLSYKYRLKRLFVKKPWPAKNIRGPRFKVFDPSL